MQQVEARFRVAAKAGPKVAELDQLKEAALEEALAWARQGHQRLHDATAALLEAQSSGQWACTDAARRRLVEAVNAGAQALAQL